MRLTKEREKEIRNIRTNDREKCHWGHVGELLDEIDESRKEYDTNVALKNAEAAYVKAAFEELVETVEQELLWDNGWKDSWAELYRAVQKAEEVLGGVRVKNESGAV